MTTMMAPADQAARDWLEHFRQRPLEALDQALTGSAHLGAFNALPAAVALGQIIADPGQTLDTVLMRWLRDHWGKTAVPGLRTRRYAQALAEALRAVDLLGLHECRRWLHRQAPRDYRWLEALEVGGPATPLDTLFSTLATAQSGTGLESFWLRLTRLEGQTPLWQGRAALVGLRLLPPADPSRPSLSPTLFGGLVQFAEGLARRQVGPEVLQEEIAYLCAIQSMTPATLAKPLRRAISQHLRDGNRHLEPEARAWLEATVPNAFKAREQGGSVPRSPTPDELAGVENLIRRGGLATAQGRLNELISCHRQYVEATGDSYYLVRCFERLSKTLRPLDPIQAVELAHEALRLAPSDAHSWMALGETLDAAGDWTRARAVFWHARRRFPYNPYAHTQLAQALLRRGEDAAALAAYAEAARRFPGDPVALGGHGHALLELHGPEAALPVLCAAVAEHGDHLPLRNDYTDALIQSGDLQEAGRQLAIVRRLNAAQPYHDPKVDELAQLIDFARVGHCPTRHRQAPAEGPGGDLDSLSDIAGRGLAQAPALGESTLFRRAGRPDLAREALGRLSAGPELDVEEGLLIAANDGWIEAARWWDGRETYEAVARIHTARSRQRAGKTVDWAPLRRDLPQFGTIIRVLDGADVPHLRVTEDAPEDLKRDAWVYREAAFTDRRDAAEEDWLAAAQVI
jgi:tetratricopeptide (TPR) repeat protein